MKRFQALSLSIAVSILFFITASNGFAASLPDLVITSVSGVPESFDLGSSISIKTTVKNKGKKKAGASVVRYYLSKDTVKSNDDLLLTGIRNVPSLKPNKNSSGTISITVPEETPAGQYYLIACADDQKKIKESSEKNNCKASQAKIEVESAVIAEPSVTPSTGPSGTMVTISGNGFTQNSTVTFGNIKADLVVFISDTELEASVPFGKEGDTIVPLTDSTITVQVDGEDIADFTVISLPDNPNPPGTVLDNTASAITQAVDSNIADYETALTGIKAATNDQSLKSAMDELIKLLPEAQKKLQDLPDLKEKLDPDTLDLLERTLLYNLGDLSSSLNSLSSTSSKMKTQALSASESGLSGDQWLENREKAAIAANAFNVLDKAVTLLAKTSPYGAIIAPYTEVISIAADRFVEINYGVINDFKLKADKGSYNGREIDIVLKNGEGAQLFATIVTQRKYTGFTDELIFLFRKKYDILVSSYSKIPGNDIAFKKEYEHTMDALEKFLAITLPSVEYKIGEPQELKLNFSKLDFGCTYGLCSPSGEPVAIDPATGAVTQTSVADKVISSWSFNIDPLYTLFDEIKYRYGATFIVPPYLKTIPDSPDLQFEASQGGPAPDPQSISIESRDSLLTNVNWYAKPDVDWLKLSGGTTPGQCATCVDGTTPATLQVGIDMTKFTSEPDGTYYGTITIFNPDKPDIDEPKIIVPVTLELSECGQTVMWKGREWQRCGSETTMGWYAANDYCADLDEGDHDDWALPSIETLRSLIVCSNGTQVDYGPDNITGLAWCGDHNSAYDVPTIDSAFKISFTIFYVTPDYSSISYPYWSSTPWAEDYAVGAWNVFFETGNVDFWYKVNSYYVRCVRGGP